MYSEYLSSRHDLLKELVTRLGQRYSYASALGKHVTGKRVNVSTVSTAVSDTNESQCGFVVRVYDGGHYAEYSFSDITPATIDQLESDIVRELSLSSHLAEQHVGAEILRDEPLVKVFDRPMEGRELGVQELVEHMTALRDAVHAASAKVIQVAMMLEYYETSAVFISRNRDLSQHYSWCNMYGLAIAREGSTVQSALASAASNSMEKTLSIMSGKTADLAKLAEDLLKAELIEPGIYDIITAPSITGLIAHEAFGHGVEMDMFVKHRARARHYMNKPVASPLVNMHDGAAVRVPAEPSSEDYEACRNDNGYMTDPCIGYFFDDDGVLAHDTQIIKDGILVSGISDAVSAAELGTEPTGNGRRQDPSRKAYTRMTNTCFAPGKDKLEDMIASVKHGYMLFDTSNGMEDPKNWNIQCVASYGREIRDGRFTGKLVAPVVMSGYVPDLLMSISMVSDEWQIIGSGHCGKGYKEWVPVSDGGPYLKARCKLG